MAILVLLSIYTSKGLSPLLKWGIPLMVAALALPVFFFFERGMIGLLGMGVLLWLGSQRRVGAFFTAVLIGLLIFLAAPDVLTEQWTARIADSISWEGGTNLTIQTTGRSEKNWPNAIKTIQESFPLGIGLGNNKVLDFAPHNQYLRWLGEFGLLGFLAMMWLLLAIWKELGRHLRSPFPLYRKVAQGLRLFFLSFLVYSLLNDPFFYSWLYFFLALMGLLINPSLARYHLRQLCSRQSYESHRLTCHYSPNV